MEGFRSFFSRMIIKLLKNFLHELYYLTYFTKLDLSHQTGFTFRSNNPRIHFFKSLLFDYFICGLNPVNTKYKAHYCIGDDGNCYFKSHDRYLLVKIPDDRVTAAVAVVIFVVAIVVVEVS